MTAAKARGPESVIGRSPDSLTLKERLSVTGKFAAFEIYTPKTLPLRTIEAIGDSLAECVQVLRQRGLDPKRYEFRVLKPPY